MCSSTHTGVFFFDMGLLHRMLVDLEQGVDRTDAKLDSAMQRMKKFIRQTEGM